MFEITGIQRVLGNGRRRQHGGDKIPPIIGTWAIEIVAVSQRHWRRVEGQHALSRTYVVLADKHSTGARALGLELM